MITTASGRDRPAGYPLGRPPGAADSCARVTLGQVATGRLAERPRKPREGIIMAARPEVVALLTDFEVKGDGSDQRFVHRDGRPFTAEETDLIGSTTDEDMRAAAAQLATVPQRLVEMVTPYLPQVGEDSGDPPATG